jgi:FkbM family methyltransferase
MHLRSVLKAIRGAPPTNWALTHGARATLRATGRSHDGLVRHLPHSGRVRTRLPNGTWARFQSRGDDGIANDVFWREWHGVEPEQTVLFYELARQARVTVDVGAHVGFYTVLAALANPAGRVYAIEPHPAAFARLEQNVALNGLSNVRAFQTAAADDDAEAEFFHVVTTGIPSSSSLSREFMTGFEEDLQTSTVPVVRLDTLLAAEEISSVDLVKLDTETTEPAVLAGMVDVLANSHPAIFCELLLEGDGEAIVRLLEPLGYRFFLLGPDGPQERSRVEPVADWRNWLFASVDPLTGRTLNS